MADFHHIACTLVLVGYTITIFVFIFFVMSKTDNILVLRNSINCIKNKPSIIPNLLRCQLCYPISFLSDSSISPCIVDIVRRTFSSYIIGVGYSWEGYILKKSFTSYALHYTVLLSTAFSTVLRIFDMQIPLPFLPNYFHLDYSKQGHNYIPSTFKSIFHIIVLGHIIHVIKNYICKWCIGVS